LALTIFLCAIPFMTAFRKPEILAPAGNWTALRAALDAGADAVYFGVRGLNMRAAADNFTRQAFPAIVRTCRAAGGTCYLALNTIIYQSEIQKVRTVLQSARDAGVNAVIAWDFGVIEAATRLGLPVHISTQMSVSNSESLLYFYRNLGVRRFVLARECTLNDVRRIRRELLDSLGEQAAGIEIEVFAHGAMCVAVSGRCFMSTLHYGTSANRGACYQPCRREYEIKAIDEDVSFRVGSGYVMSPRDLCTLPFIEKLLTAGVNSLKIEGRNRSPEYVATVVGAYRRAVDFYCANRGRRQFRQEFEALKREELDRLERVYHRGFSNGFFMGRPVADWTDGSGSRSTVRKEYVGRVTKHFRHVGVSEIMIESNVFQIGDTILFQGPTTGVFEQVAESMEINHVKVDVSRKGQSIALKTAQVTRKNDQVYVLRSR
jgi:putative protease